MYAEEDSGCIWCKDVSCSSQVTHWGLPSVVHVRAHTHTHGKKRGWSPLICEMFLALCSTLNPRPKTLVCVGKPRTVRDIAFYTCLKKKMKVGRVVDNSRILATQFDVFLVDILDIRCVHNWLWICVSGNTRATMCCEKVVESSRPNSPAHQLSVCLSFFLSFFSLSFLSLSLSWFCGLQKQLRRGTCAEEINLKATFTGFHLLFIHYLTPKDVLFPQKVNILTRAWSLLSTREHPGINILCSAASLVRWRSDWQQLV